MFYTDIKTNNIDKWVVMNILQSKGIISFDEDNYHSMNCRTYGATHIMIMFSGHTKEFITIDEYKTFKRNITIDKVLE